MALKPPGPAGYVKLKPIYRLSELVRMTSLSRRRFLTLLRAAEVPVERIGFHFVVYACDLQVRLPKLWQSLLACAGKSPNGEPESSSKKAERR